MELPPVRDAQMGVGDRVAHNTYGSGRVIGDDVDSVLVVFDHCGTHQIVRSHPGLRLLGPWAEGRISPPRAEMEDPERFSPPLGRGERELIALLDSHLAPEWRLYVRPHLDAERPLLMAVHPNLGGMIWDVVGWDPNKVAVDGAVWTVATDDGPRRLRSPLEYLDEVRRRLYGIYLPAIGEEINEERSRFGLVRAGLYFENADSRDVARFGASKYTVFGRDAVASRQVSRVMPVFPVSSPWRPEWFAEFDAVLGRVYRMPDALSAHPISAEQRRLSTPRAGTDLIDGVAGSGKSLVLAYRAAHIAASGRRVLVLTYNRTLPNYLRALMRRVPVRHDPELVTILHLHGLLARIFEHHRLPKPTRQGTGSDRMAAWLDRDWPDAAANALDVNGIPAQLRFDAVLIDEAQDFCATYMPPIQRLVSGTAEPEVVLALDLAQRVYRRSESIADGGPWSRGARSRSMKRGYRLAGSSAAAANAFAARWHLPTSPIEPRDDALLPGKFDWIGVVDDGAAVGALIALLDSWKAERDFLPGRVAVLTASTPLGQTLVRMLDEHGFSANHVFGVRRTAGLLDLDGGIDSGRSWLIGKSRKAAFSPADSRIKVSTIHSFKGWDADRVVVVLPHSSEDPSDEVLAQIYVAITRATEQVVVIGCGDGFGIEGLATPISVVAGKSVEQRARELYREALAGAVKDRISDELDDWE